MTRLFAALVLVLGLALPAAAQDRVWIQIEARPSLNNALERAEIYSQRFADVSGFSLGGRWYGIVLGPYREADAPRILAQLKAARSIPADSFIADGRNFGEPFWPVGARPVTESVEDPAVAEVEPIEEPVIREADETPQEARATEAQLTRPEREELQIALQWAGFYRSSIDGAFGRGTRAAMGEWQVANNYEPTGILTTGQRAELLATYNAILDGMDLTVVSDSIAGVSLEVPLGVVTFDRYDPPFARFSPTGEIEAQVLIISQEGSRATLWGLYDILQTLEIVPPNGPRVRNQTSFEIEGFNDEIHSYSFAELQGSEIKGFVLVWPAGDEDRRTRILREMRASFARLDGVMDPSMAEPSEDQAIDLISGLAVRMPERSRSGVFLDPAGSVLTVAEAVDSCGRVTIDRDIEAEVVLLDTASGLAVLSPLSPVAPPRSVVFQARVPRLQSEIAVAGYPFEGVLSAPTLTFGRLADLRGLGGEDGIKRAALTAQPGDVGGAVFDATGAALGILLPRRDSGQQLPDDVAFFADVETIQTTLEAAGFLPVLNETSGAISPQELTRRAASMTVLVSCWAE